MEQSDNAHVLYLWKSVYEFSPEFVNEIINKLKKIEGLKGVKYEFTHVKQTFRLDGPKKKVEDAFHVLLQLVWDETKIKKKQPTRIKRSPLAEAYTQHIFWTEDLDNEQVSVEGLTGQDGAYKRSQIWSPKAASDFYKILYPQESKRDVMQELMTVCNCNIESDWTGQKLYIQADDDQTIGRITRKLNKLEELCNKTFEPKTDHLIYAEEKSRFQIKLYSLYRQRTTAGKTTLLYKKKLYSDRKLLHTMRLLEPELDEQRKETWVVSILQPQEIPGIREYNGPRDWHDYVFRSHGFHPEIPKNTATATRATTQSQLSYIESREQAAHAIELASRLEDLQSTTNADPDDEFSFLNNRQRPNPPEIEGRKPLPASTRRTVRPSRSAQNSGATVAADAPPAAPVRNDKAAKPIREPLRKQELKIESLIDLGESSVSMEVSPGQPLVSTSNMNDLLLLEGPGANGVDGVLAIPRSKAKKEVPVTLPAATKRMVRKKNPAPAIEDVLEKPAEAKQETSEQDTRELRQGTQQRKSAPGGSQQTASASARLRDVMIHGLNFARTQKCRLYLQAKIGRIIYINPPSSLTTKKFIVDREKWEDIVEDQADRLNIFFTDRVTTDDIDVDHVIDLKRTNIENLFDKKPYEQNVWYEFTCDYRGKVCVVRIDAETFEVEALGRLETYGTAYWNCPLRSWDAQFTLQARTVLNPNEPAFKDLAASLYVSSDSQTPELIVKNSHDDLVIKRVFCKREARYYTSSTVSGPQNEVVLAIMEVQELALQEHAKSSDINKFVALDRMGMIADERLHFTFTLIPASVEPRLLKQSKLEIGEEAEWTSRQILGGERDGAVYALINVVNQVVKKIDDVGYGNQGHWVDQEE